MREPEIDFDPRSSDARRERTERAVLSRLAAIQALGEADAVLAPSPPKIRWFTVGFAGAAVAAAILFVVLRSDSRVDVPSEAPSLVVTPVGGSSRFTVGDSVIEAGGDTSVEVQREAGGATTLLLTRGTVDCDVTPRPGRPLFRVLAGEIEVVVVGTRFSVARVAGTVRVDVTRGKVRVKSRTEERLLEAGGSWTPTSVAAVVPPAPPPTSVVPEANGTLPATGDDAVIEMPAEETSTPAPPARTSSRTAFAAAQRLESKDPGEAARAYRTIANGKDVWASLALYSLAELHAAKQPAAALGDLDELAKRFPRGANAEDGAWLRVEVLRKLGRADDARAAAVRYLREYPSGTYVKAAARLASP